MKGNVWKALWGKVKGKAWLLVILLIAGAAVGTAALGYVPMPDLSGGEAETAPAPDVVLAEAVNDENAPCGMFVSQLVAHGLDEKLEQAAGAVLTTGQYEIVTYTQYHGLLLFEAVGIPQRPRAGSGQEVWVFVFVWDGTTWVYHDSQYLTNMDAMRVDLERMQEAEE